MSRSRFVSDEQRRAVMARLKGKGKAGILPTRMYGGKPFHVLRDPVHGMAVRFFASAGEAAAESAALQKAGFLTRVQPAGHRYVIYSRVGAEREKLLMSARRQTWSGAYATRGKAPVREGAEEPPASLRMAGSTYYLSRKFHYGPTARYVGGYRTRSEAAAAVQRDIEKKPDWYRGKWVEIVWDLGGYHVYVAPRPIHGKHGKGKSETGKREGR